MFCEGCLAETESRFIDGHEACAMCGQAVRGGPSVHTSAFARRALKPEKIHKSVASALIAHAAADALSPIDQSAIARVAQASIVAAFAGGRAPAGAARALANRAVDELCAGPSVQNVIVAAESIVAEKEPRALGKARAAETMLAEARRRGACMPTNRITEGAWALAAVVAATCPPPISDNFETAARDAALRCDVPLKTVCVEAIADVWRFSSQSLGL